MKIRQLVPFPEHSDLATVVHVLVTLRLDCCNALYMGQIWKHSGCYWVSPEGAYSACTQPVLKALSQAS